MHETSQGLPRPVDRIGDLEAHYHHAGIKDLSAEADAYVHATVAASGILWDIDLEQTDSLELDDTKMDYLAFWSSVARHMRPYAEAASPTYMRRDTERMAEFEHTKNLEIKDKHPDGRRIFNLMEGPIEYSPDELIDITLAHLGAVQRYLETADLRSFWPGQKKYGQAQVGDYKEASDLDMIRQLAAKLDNRDEGSRSDLLSSAMTSLASLYCEAGHIGRAIGMLGALDPEADNADLIDGIVELFGVVKEEYGDEWHQKNYNYATWLLRGSTLEIFESKAVPTSIPLIEGSIVQEVWNGAELVRIHEDWEEVRQIEATTDYTDIVDMYFTEFRSRAIYDRGKPSEHSINDRQYSVDFTDLPAEAKQVIIDQQTGERRDGADHQFEMKKIRFSMGHKLQAKPIPAGLRDLTPERDVNHIATEAQEYRIDMIEEVGSTWMTSECTGNYLDRECYTLDEILRVAPDGANTFWFSGGSRIVNLTPKYFPPEERKQVILTPVRFYKTS